MQTRSSKISQHILCVGGGHSHAIALRLLGQHPIPDTRITLLTEAPDTPYSGMLPGYVAGIYQRSDCHIDLRPLAQFAKANLIINQAVGLDLDRQQVTCADGTTVGYDWLSLDIGSTPQMPKGFGTAVLSDRVIPAKPVGQFLARWEQLVVQVCTQPQPSFCLGIVGGGAGGVELAVSVLQRLQGCQRSLGQPPTSIQLHLFQRDAELLPSHHAWVRQRFREILTARGVTLHFQAEVIEVQPQRVRCRSGLTVNCDAVIWVTQAAAPDWIAASGLRVDPAGFVLVEDSLRSLSHPRVFATGDIATMVNHARPKAGVFAVRQGKPLAENLRRAIQGRPLQAFYPQRDYLSLISTGDGQAVASRGNWGGRSPLFWWGKAWIDRQFMDQFQSLS